MEEEKREITIQDTVADIVSLSPNSASVFQKYDIDFCCGGKTSLQDVCQEKKLDVTKVLNELATVSQEPIKGTEQRSWDGETNVNTIIDYILETYHEPLKVELPRLEALMHKVASVHGANHPELKEMESILVALKAELLSHLEKEETILFPLMQSIYDAYKTQTPMTVVSHCGSVNNPIRRMEMEHDEAGQALRALRQLSKDFQPPSDACNSYRVLLMGLYDLEQDLHRHIHLENAVLHPLTSRMEHEVVVSQK